MEISERTQQILKAMTADAYERNEVMALSLLSALAEESIFLLGLPGVGKSMMARKLKMAFENARSFEYLMSRFSTPDEIFGPVSITKLREHDTYERITKGYLPESEIVFLDEIWKAGPAIQNSLLTVLNEKIYRNGDCDMRLPIRGIIAASNELPAEGEGLEALWDRFLLRYIVKPIEVRENFNNLILGVKNASKVNAIAPFTQKECDELREKVRECEMPHEIVDMMYDLREKMNAFAKTETDDTSKENINEMKYYVSDRRWRKMAHVMKVSACVNGRKRVDVSDFMLLVHMLWNSDDCCDNCRNAVAQCVAMHCLRDYMKSNSRKNKGRAETLVKDDGTHYVVDCNGYTFKIKIADYETMLKNSREVYFGHEVNDGEIEMVDYGPFVIQVHKAGYVNINSYSFPLRRSGETLATNAPLCTNESVEDVYASLLRLINENMFVANSNFTTVLHNLFSEYEKKFRQIQR